jgi:hypothetical protein
MRFSTSEDWIFFSQRLMVRLPQTFWNFGFNLYNDMFDFLRPSRVRSLVCDCFFVLFDCCFCFFFGTCRLSGMFGANGNNYIIECRAYATELTPEGP